MVAITSSSRPEDDMSQTSAPNEMSWVPESAVWNARVNARLADRSFQALDAETRAK